MSAWGTIVTATPVKPSPRLILPLLSALCCCVNVLSVGASVFLPLHWWQRSDRWLLGSGLFCTPAPHSMTQICSPLWKKKKSFCFRWRSASIKILDSDMAGALSHTHAPAPHLRDASWLRLNKRRDVFTLSSHFVAGGKHSFWHGNMSLWVQRLHSYFRLPLFYHKETITWTNKKSACGVCHIFNHWSIFFSCCLELLYRKLHLRSDKCEHLLHHYSYYYLAGWGRFISFYGLQSSVWKQLDMPHRNIKFHQYLLSSAMVWWHHLFILRHLTFDIRFTALIWSHLGF